MKTCESYRDAERLAVQAFAYGVYTDPSATDAERAAAHDRLMRDGEAKADYSRLSTDELRAYVDAIRIAGPLMLKLRAKATPQRKPRAPRARPTASAPSIRLPPAPAVTYASIDELPDE
jgi:hypothetical protein